MNLDIHPYEEIGSVFADYNARLMSFFTKQWQKSVSPAKLAASGFKFTGFRDRTICVFCKVELEQWLDGDIPDKDHYKESPHCPFIRFKLLPVIDALYEEGYGEEAIMKAHETLMMKVSVSDLKAFLPDTKVSDRSDPKCKICLDKYACILFLPCRHLVCCSDCDRNFANCCVCKQLIDHHLPVFT